MNPVLAAALTVGTLAVDLFVAAPAVAQTRAVVGRVTSTTTVRPDGSKEVVTPDGKHSFYNSNGTPQGINRTCSSSGLIVNCTNWGPNSYGGR
jgi:uncharacterized protein YfaP (DUF2135 family)